MKLNVLNQRRVIRDPKDLENTSTPTMPLIIALNNGLVGEATSIRGLLSFVIGDEYFDTEDREMEWYHRLSTARRESMKALAQDIFVEVYDQRKGVIQNNYAADPQDPDYEVETNEEVSEKIRIENDRLFLLSLLKIGAFIVLEREDSFQLRSHPDWEKLKNKEKQQACSSCLHRKIDQKISSLVCPVYATKVSNEDGNYCPNYALPIDPENLEYEGGEYIDIAQSYDMDILMKKIGQEWIVK